MEVVSRSNANLDRKMKYERYALNRVPHYWMVDPRKQQIECFSLSKDGLYVLDILVSGGESCEIPGFPGLKIDLGQLWRWPSPRS